jgi:chorismate mutase
MQSGLIVTKGRRLEMAKFVAVGMLVISMLRAEPSASGQMMCSVAPPTAKQQPGSNRNSATRPFPGGKVLRGLVVERLSLMTDVAKTKWNSGSEIEDPIREQQLLSDVGVKAQTLGVPTEWAQHFFRFQIEAAKQVQYCLFAQWTTQHQGSFSEVQDLRTGIRPKLDRLTTELLQELAKQWPELNKSEPSQAKKFMHEKSPGEFTVRLAVLPLVDGSILSSHRGPAVKSK